MPTAKQNKLYTIRFTRPYPLTWAENEFKKIQTAAASGRPFACEVHLRTGWYPEQADYPHVYLSAEAANSEKRGLDRVAKKLSAATGVVLKKGAVSPGEDVVSYFVDNARAFVFLAFGTKFADGLTNAQYIGLYDAAYRLWDVPASVGHEKMSQAIERYKVDVAEALFDCEIVSGYASDGSNPFGYTYICEKGLEAGVLDALREFGDRIKTLAVYENDMLIDKFDYYATANGQMGKTFVGVAADRLGCGVKDIEADLKYWGR